MTKQSADVDKLIEELGNICHEGYGGCVQSNLGDWEYIYNKEVINLLNTPEAKAKINRLLIEARMDEIKRLEYTVIKSAKFTGQSLDEVFPAAIDLRKLQLTQQLERGKG